MVAMRIKSTFLGAWVVACGSTISSCCACIPKPSLGGARLTNTLVCMHSKSQNVSLSLAKSGSCLKMPGDEHKTMNRAENHARLAIISSTMSVQTTVSQELRRGKGYIRCQSVSLALAIVKNCLKRPGKARTTRTKPGPSHGQVYCSV